MATNAKGLRRVSFSAVFEKFKLVCERKWDMDKVLKDRHLIHPNGRGAQKEVGGRGREDGRSSRVNRETRF